jgi:putative glycerol-1-phosphate prenyltransferase
MKNFYDLIIHKKQQGKKSFAVLVDPDKTENLDILLGEAKKSPPDVFLVGGSLLNEKNLEACILQIREKSNAPVILFPGNEMQVSSSADGLLLLSLISGRNPDFLIGRHVTAAGMIRASGIEIISTGYILVESGETTAVNYISNTQPVPRKNNSIAALTALAGEQLGLKMIYLEAGSGALQPVPVEMIAAVKKNISVPLVTGGGLKTKAEIEDRCKAGADMIVVGNVLEVQPELLTSFAEIIHSF